MRGDVGAAHQHPNFRDVLARIGGHREAIERSANVSRVFLLVARVDEGWVTIPSYGNKNGSPRFEPMSKYEKWLARPIAVLPASDLLSFVYEKCEQIRRGSDNARSRKKP